MDAKQIIEKAKEVLQNSGIKEYPVKIIKLCEQAGIRVYQEYLPENVSGFIVIQEENFGKYDFNRIISVNRRDSVARRRFTVAHELGHYYLHRDQKNQLYAHRDAGQSGQIETEANIFASNLLMPEKMVKQAIDYLDYDEGGSLPDTLKILTVAHEFNVSRDAATVRLKQLKII